MNLDHSMSNVNQQSCTSNVNNMHCIRLMCWNIQGLMNNVKTDDYFENIVHKHDIIILTETWLAEHDNVFGNEYFNYHNIRPMHAKARRPSGGISILIRHSLRGTSKSKCISIIKEMDYFVWIKLNKNDFKLSKDISLGLYHKISIV